MYKKLNARDIFRVFCALFDNSFGYILGSNLIFEKSLFMLVFISSCISFLTAI